MNIGFIGAGKIAEAILSSLINSKYSSSDRIYASDVHMERLAFMRRTYSIKVINTNRQLAEACDVIFLCVKPFQIEDVMKEISPAVKSSHMVVSVAAGKHIELIEKCLPRARVVRIMPNLPCQVGEGVTAFCMGNKTKPKDRKTVIELLKCFGKEVEMEEGLFDAVTAISGSGPAFYAYFTHCLVDAGQTMGVPRDKATLLAEQTMLGTAKLLMKRKMDPIDLINAVKTPKGTTEAGLDVMKQRGLHDITVKVIKAAAKRSKELSR